MLSDKEIVCPNNLLDVAHRKKGILAGIVNAGKPLTMMSVMDAVNENLITPIFIGDKEDIDKCALDLNFDISNFEIIDEKSENKTSEIAADLASKGAIKIINGTDIILIKLKMAVNEIDKATSPFANLVKTFEVTPPGAAAMIITPSASSRGVFKTLISKKATIGSKIS